MKLEWRNIWAPDDDWRPLDATTLETANRELQRHMPYSEESVIRDTETGQKWRWRPPREEIHFGP